MNSVLTNHPGLMNRFLASNIFLLHKDFGFSEFPGLTNNWLGPARFVKSGRHCTSIPYPKTQWMDILQFHPFVVSRSIVFSFCSLVESRRKKTFFPNFSFPIFGRQCRARSGFSVVSSPGRTAAVLTEFTPMASWRSTRTDPKLGFLLSFSGSVAVAWGKKGEKIHFKYSSMVLPICTDFPAAIYSIFLDVVQ